MLAREAAAGEEGVVAALLVGSTVAEVVDVWGDVCVVLEEGSGRAEYGAASASFLESCAARRSKEGQPFCWQGLEVQQPMKVGSVL